MVLNHIMEMLFKCLFFMSVNTFASRLWSLLYIKSVCLNNVIDPAQEFGDFGVNSRMVGFSTACAPADDAHQPPHTFILADQRTPTVPLERQRQILPYRLLQPPLWQHCLKQNHRGEGESSQHLCKVPLKTCIRPDTHRLFPLCIRHKASVTWSPHCTCRCCCTSLCL